MKQTREHPFPVLGCRDPDNMTTAELLYAIVEHKRFREIRHEPGRWLVEVAGICSWRKTFRDAAVDLLNELLRRAHRDENGEL